MALITSAASGNFNATATWVGGVIPGVGDEARASTGHTITITANATCDTVSNAGTGTYVLNNAVTLTANIVAGTAAVGVLSLTGSNSAAIVGGITSGTGASSQGVLMSSTGTLTIVGNILARSGADAFGVWINSAGSIIVTGNVTGGTGSNSSFPTHGIRSTAASSVTITGNLIAGSVGLSHAVQNSSTGSVTVVGSITGSGTASIVGLNNASTGTITVTGNVTAGSGSASHAILNATTGSLTIVGDVTATNSAPAISSTNASGVLKISGSFISSQNGTLPVYAQKFILNATPSVAKTRYALNGTGTYVDMFTADNSLGQAAVADVRSGTVYASGLLTGTCAVPAAGSVSLGVPVGSGTGTAILTAAAIRAELAVELARIDAAVSSRLAPSGTLATVTTLTNAPTVPSAAAIATQVRTELATELARVDAAVSTRLASSAYSAAPTTAQIATAVEGSLLNEADGQTVLAAIVGAIGNTNLSEVSIVAAVRADLERVGGKIDSIPTTAAPTAAANATAVWSAATKEITGGTVTTLTNSPSVPSAAAIATQVRTELATELARVDVATSTRLAGSAYTAPSNSDITAIKAKTDLLNPDRLANVATTAIVGNLIAQANS